MIKRLKVGSLSAKNLLGLISGVDLVELLGLGAKHLRVQLQLAQVE